MASRGKSKTRRRSKATSCWGCGESSLKLNEDSICFLCENTLSRKDITSKSTYRGDCPTKKLARYNAYVDGNKHRDNLQWRHKGGWAIVLAGDEAAEVGCVVHLHKHPIDKIIVVDMDSRGIRKAEQQWPGIRTYQGDLKDLLLAMPYRSVDFIHFDFMGHVHGDVLGIVRASRDKLSQGAVVLYTFFHGRDHSKPYYEETRRRGQAYLRKITCKETQERLKKDKTFASKMERTAGNVDRIMEALSPSGESDGDSVLFTSYEYQSSSPMEVLVFGYWRGYKKRLSKLERTSNRKGGVKLTPGLKEFLDAHLNVQGSRYPIILREMKHIRELTFLLLKPGHLSISHPLRALTDLEVSEILNIELSTIAAWKAHRTRGTYDGIPDSWSPEDYMELS